MGKVSGRQCRSIALNKWCHPLAWRIFMTDMLHWLQMRKKFDKKICWEYWKYFAVHYLMPKKNSLSNNDMRFYKVLKAKRDYNCMCEKSSQSVWHNPSGSKQRKKLNKKNCNKLKLCGIFPISRKNYSHVKLLTLDI